MKKQLFLLLLGCALFTGARSQQDFSTDYTPVKSSGNLPEDFTTSASARAVKDIEKLQKKSGKTAQQKISFIISSTFFLDNVLKSGRVLYGDPISVYVNKVAEKVMEADPALKGKIRVYVVKSPVVNAYTFDNGVVLVNTGLISQLENEAQLAFVLCHEFIHYKRKHSINAYIDFLKIDKKKKSYNRNGTSLLLEKSRYSQKNETQADEEGFDLYAKTAYNFKPLDGLFDVLQYSYLPFDEVDFDKTFFNDKSLVLPNDYFLDKVKEIGSDDNYDDSLSTHPNIAKRRKSIADKIGGKSDNGRVDFIFPKSEFEQERDLARFETCRMYMQELDYPEAIYSAYILLQKYPNNLYLKKVIARSLYEVAAYKSLYEKYSYTISFNNYTATYYKKREKSDVDRVLDMTNEIQGSSQQVFNLLKKLSPLEATVLALNNNWKLNKAENFSDPYTQEVCDSLMHILSGKFELGVDDFSKIYATAKKDSTPLTADVKGKEMSKYDKIRKGKNSKTGKKLDENDFIKYAFVDFMTDTKFTDLFRAAQKEEKKQKKENTTASNKKPVKKPAPKKPAPKKKGGKDQEEEEANSGDGEMAAGDSVKIDPNDFVSETTPAKTKEKDDFKMLGLDKIVIVDPFYLKMDLRKKENVSYFSGELKQKKFVNLLEDNARIIKMDCEILDPSGFQDDDMDKYNDFSLINDWVTERMNHGSFDDALVLNDEFKDKLLKKYGTSYFMWTGTINMREKKTGVGGTILLTLVVPYILPYTIGYIATPKYDTYYYAVLFNIETGKVELFNEHLVNMKDNSDVLNSVIYDTFYQVSQKPKK